MKRMMLGVLMTLVLLAGYAAVADLYDTTRGAIEGPAAVGQLQDGSAHYAASRFAARGGLLTAARLCLAAGLLATWGGIGLSLLHDKQRESDLKHAVEE